jgi:hypothetical protein
MFVAPTVARLLNTGWVFPGWEDTMTRATHVSTIVLATLAVLWLATPQAEAQVRGYPDRGAWSGGHGYGDDVRHGPGFNRGFDDGYREGRDAARDGDRFAPSRERRYRDADRGYNRRYGSREFYRQAYREGFRTGYERGYREVFRSYRHGRSWGW